MVKDWPRFFLPAFSSALFPDGEIEDGSGVFLPAFSSALFPDGEIEDGSGVFLPAFSSALFPDGEIEDGSGVFLPAFSSALFPDGEIEDWPLFLSFVGVLLKISDTLCLRFLNLSVFSLNQLIALSAVSKIFCSFDEGGVGELTDRS
ncbi:hypothetical protein [Candidatus Phytoplasma fabacearum]|uniref:hypothetical protein n=1 Tax=Candidatus Phytoplasma fabacearum TaxID=2982628 RepID=UPI0027132B1C|nr:hypothetical protein ['Bituminaria bituminosa' little leaf phytoplasma]MDO8023745.1 hypothetical protein ['Bituminaria bituminosa' little leaf phytoplasma]